MDANEFQKFLEKQKDYVQLTYGDYQEFIFGEEITAYLMEMPFGCKRCGGCCIDSKSNACGELKTVEGKKACNIYGTKEYSMTCMTYPIILDEKAVEGHGYRITIHHDPIRHVPEKYVYWEFGLADIALTLMLYPNDPCWEQPGKPLREHYMELLSKLANDFDRPVQPPHASLAQLMDSNTGMMVEADSFEKKNEMMEDASVPFKRRLMARKDYFDIKLFKIRHKDYSHGI